jgi:hypothetical protein
VGQRELRRAQTLSQEALELKKKEKKKMEAAGLKHHL